MSRKESLVIRFNGGNQAGHSVVYGDKIHTFSIFGSGTLKGAKTYLSKYVTFDPLALKTEKEVLGFFPELYIDANATLITPYDVFHNRNSQKYLKNGTVGIGYGTTIERESHGIKIYARDMLYPIVLKEKLKNIGKFYAEPVSSDDIIDNWLESIKEIVSHYEIIRTIHDIPNWYNHLIFEGSQGILLDQKYGFFPNVTRSNTTIINAMKLIYSWRLGSNDISTYYVSRAYHTRHGIGVLPGEEIDISNYINPNLSELNVENEYQGKFRRSLLNIELLQYSMNVCRDISSSLRKMSETLVLTCIDNIIDYDINFNLDLPIIPTLEQDIVIKRPIRYIANMLNIENIIISNSPSLVI